MSKFKLKNLLKVDESYSYRNKNAQINITKEDDGELYVELLDLNDNKENEYNGYLKAMINIKNYVDREINEVWKNR